MEGKSVKLSCIFKGLKEYNYIMFKIKSYTGNILL